MSNKTLYIIVPCYNEEAVILDSSKTLMEKLIDLEEKGLISRDSKILFVDDGSSDDTWMLLLGLYAENKKFSALRLSKNAGHQNALFAGLAQARDMCDIAISIDADLQQDVAVMDEFLIKHYEGNDIVYGVRNNRATDSFIKRFTATLFYKAMKTLGADIIKNHADYRLMSKTAIDALMQYKEVNLFLRGMVPLLGFRHGFVYFDVSERKAGKSKYTFAKMISLAVNGITSFSVRPIRLISILGILVFSITVVVMIFFIIAFFAGQTIQGWASTVLSIWLIGGLQLFSIGIIGEYISKTYMETKERPRYIVWEFLHEKGAGKKDEHR